MEVLREAAVEEVPASLSLLELRHQLFRCSVPSQVRELAVPDSDSLHFLAAAAWQPLGSAQAVKPLLARRLTSPQQPHHVAAVQRCVRSAIPFQT